jgi:hypothetical protein
MADPPSKVSGFGYLVFSLSALSQSFAHLFYLLLKSWLLSHSLLKFQPNHLVSGFGYLVFSLPVLSQSFAQLVYLLPKSWFLCHSLLKFLYPKRKR